MGIRVAAFVLLLGVLQAVEGGAVSVQNDGVKHVGSGSGSMKHAPHWLQQDEPGLYFPLAQHAAKEAQRGRKLAGGELLSWGVSLGEADGYYTTVALGSEDQLFNVAISTGSSLFWVQCDCMQCATSAPASKKNAVTIHPPFDTSASSTYISEACNGTTCAAYGAGSTFTYGCNVAEAYIGSSSLCQYSYNYVSGDKASSGKIGMDTISLTLTSGETAKPVISYGCGMYQSSNLINSSISTVYDGALGLGPESYSLVNQLSASQISANSFSLCLDRVGELSHLLIGRTSLPVGAVYTPLINSSRWSINLETISISNVNVTANVELIFNLDLLVIPILPADLYRAIFSAVLQQNASSLSVYPYISCSIQEGFVGLASLVGIFPPVVLKMAGGASMSISAAKYLTSSYNQTSNTTRVCVAALGVEGITMAYIGTSWLHNYDVLFDAEIGRIGWVAINCTSGLSLSTEEPLYAFPPSTTPAGDTLAAAPAASPPSPSPAESPLATPSPLLVSSPPPSTASPPPSIGSSPPPTSALVSTPPPPPSHGESRYAMPQYSPILLLCLALGLAFH